MNNFERNSKEQNMPSVPGAFHVNTRAAGQCPQWGRRIMRQRRSAVAESPIVATVVTESCEQYPVATELSTSGDTSKNQEQPKTDNRAGRFPLSRMFSKKRLKKRSDRSPPPPPSRPTVSTTPDNPMDVNPKQEVAVSVPVAVVHQHSIEEPPSVRPAAASGSRRNVMSFMRAMSYRRPLSFQRIKEIIPNAREDRVTQLRSQGVSVRTIVNMFMEEAEEIARVEDNEEVCVMSPHEEPMRSLLLAGIPTEQEDSKRLLQILEVFPDASRHAVKERLDHGNSMETVIQDLADLSTASSSPHSAIEQYD